MTLSRDSHTATLDGHEVPLTTREFSILALLMEQPRRAFSRAQIYESVWGEEFMGDENTVNVHVSNLRSKLSKAGPAGSISRPCGGSALRWQRRSEKAVRSELRLSLHFL